MSRTLSVFKWTGAVTAWVALGQTYKLHVHTQRLQLEVARADVADDRCRYWDAVRDWCRQKEKSLELPKEDWQRQRTILARHLRAEFEAYVVGTCVPPGVNLPSDKPSDRPVTKDLYDYIMEKTKRPANDSPIEAPVWRKSSYLDQVMIAALADDVFPEATPGCAFLGYLGYAFPGYAFPGSHGRPHINNIEDWCCVVAYLEFYHQTRHGERKTNKRDFDDFFQPVKYEHLEKAAKKKGITLRNAFPRTTKNVASPDVPCSRLTYPAPSECHELGAVCLVFLSSMLIVATSFW